jgi:hypothetical protein
VQSRTVKLVRGQPGQEFPDYKEAIVRFPIISGLPNRAIQRKVQEAVSLKTVFESSLEEMRQEFQTRSYWLSEIEYEINYNQNFLLDITFTRSGVGAYPSSYDHHVVVDLRTGNPLTAADLFEPKSLPQLRELVDQALRSQVATKLAELRQTYDPSDLEFVQERLEKRSFEQKDLDTFSISDRGITFFYDYDLPHVAKPAEPSGRFFFTYEQLKDYIQPQGPLRPFTTR